MTFFIRGGGEGWGEGVKSLHHNTIFLQLETGGRTSIAIYFFRKLTVDRFVQWDLTYRVKCRQFKLSISTLFIAVYRNDRNGGL